MIAHTLQCPNCGSRLTVSAAAPKVITCPRCLYRMVNPHAGETDAIAAPPLPMRVLPLETQATGDAGATNVMLIVMVVLLAAGAFISATTLGVGSAMFNFLILLLLLAFTVIAIVASYRKQKHELEMAAAIEKLPRMSASERAAISYRAPGVINYHTPNSSEPTNALAAAGGFFSAIAVCAAGFFILAGTSGMGSTSGAAARADRGMILLLVVAMAIGYMIGAPILSRRQGWKGFGTGATIGLVLGLLALGPCAFCYLLTLG